VLVGEQTRLGGVLDAWLRRQPPAHVAKRGKVSRNTIWLIQQGTTTTPEVETLRKIARGLAADPYTGEIERTAYLAAWRDLAAAANLPDPTTDVPPATLESGVRAVVADQRRADALAAFVRKYPNMSPDQRKLVDALIDNLPD